MEKGNYISMVGKISDGFCANGWADGFADLPSAHEEILNQLFNVVSNSDLVECLDLYLQGYELGSFMSQASAEIYDEDGFLKENEYDLTTFSHSEEAKRLVFNRMTNIN